MAQWTLVQALSGIRRPVEQSKYQAVPASTRAEKPRERDNSSANVETFLELFWNLVYMKQGFL